MGLQRVRQDEWLHFHRGSEEANSADTFEGQLQAETMRLMAEVMPPAWRVYAAARRLESGGGGWWRVRCWGIRDKDLWCGMKLSIIFKLSLFDLKSINLTIVH